MNGFVKKTVIFFLVMAVVGFGGWFGSKVYRKTTEHHLIAQARAYLDKKDLHNSSLCLQRALQINPYNVEGCSLYADLLEAEGSSAALSWRIRTVQLQTNNVDYRLAWADTALRLERYFGSEAKGWLNLQAAYELRVAEIANGKTIAREIRPFALAA